MWSINVQLVTGWPLNEKVKTLIYSKTWCFRFACLCVCVSVCLSNGKCTSRIREKKSPPQETEVKDFNPQMCHQLICWKMTPRPLLLIVLLSTNGHIVLPISWGLRNKGRSVDNTLLAVLQKSSCLGRVSTGDFSNCDSREIRTWASDHFFPWSMWENPRMTPTKWSWGRCGDALPFCLCKRHWFSEIS